MRLTGAVGEKIIRKVMITTNPKYPFKIIKSAPLPATKDKFKYELKKLKDGLPGYELIVENLQPSKGNYYGKIILYTDNSHRKEIKIPVHGNIYDRVKKKAAVPMAPDKKGISVGSGKAGKK